MQVDQLTLQKAFLVALCHSFSKGCFGLTRLQKLTYFSQRDCPVTFFTYKRWNHGQFSEQVAGLLEGMTDANALEADRGDCTVIRLASDELGDTAQEILEKAIPGCLDAIREAVSRYGYLSQEELLEAAYSLPEMKDASRGQILAKVNLPSVVEIEIGEDRLESFCLGTNAAFVSPLQSLAEVLDGTTVDEAMLNEIISVN